MAQQFVALNGREGRVTIEEAKRIRTLRQNRYYWGVVLMYIAAHTGHHKNELHHYFKEMFVEKKFISIGGKEMEIPKSTTSLSTKEMVDYVENVRIFAGENLSIVIPLPELSGVCQ